ncbi:PIN domain nuclease [candidate division WS5 bacterium]|uniref:PIN domain nuclease n=1 Tax=candidate division WS5 bacterium TaxID=2093353 RepID=A0A419DAH2_9BACT|nr:MAG: PIN domain nuclease [candidate division WS5 bacterium]
MGTDTILVLVVLALVIGGIFATKLFIKLPAKKIFVGIPAIIIGLIIGALVSIPLQRLPGDFGIWVPVTVSAICVFASLYLFYAKTEGIEKFFNDVFKLIKLPKLAEDAGDRKKEKNKIILDTSAIIDGRFLEVVRTGFLSGRFLLFRFVLHELQNIADSSENLRREKGKRGLEVLDKLKKERGVKLEVTSENVEDIDEVDAKLVKLAKQKGAIILTTDYNLNKVAKIQGVKVLNINELSEAIKPIIIPGEKMNLKVVQLGKDKTQGVGYLADGTMIVVEKGGKLVGREVRVVITRILQTPAGKMYFAKINGKNS